MKYTTIPNTDIKVSKICLGTMTFGEQNTEKEAHEQLDYALSQGVNFIDTAELYAIPSKEATQGLTEQYIGSWITERKNRDQFILATKIAGPSRGLDYIRPHLGFSKEALEDALSKSLKRLKTDYIDLYQLHWPDRNVNNFGQRDYKYISDERWNDNIHEVINVLDTWVKQGKIRHYGLSNETPWGTMRHIWESDKHHLTRVKTIQNPYSLVNRTFEIGLSEICRRENIGLLPYSPLAFGKLSGKFRHGKRPENTRITLFPQMKRYNRKQVDDAIELYAAIAEKHGLSLAQMALSFVNQQAFVTSTIIGATTLNQLKENIESIHVNLSSNIIDEINTVHDLIPNPAP